MWFFPANHENENLSFFQIRANEKALEEMQTTNYALTERLENVYRSMSLSPHHQTTSLLNEMEMSDSEKSLNASRRPFSQIDEDEDVEVENPEIRINSEELTDEVCKYFVQCTYFIW